MAAISAYSGAKDVSTVVSDLTGQLVAAGNDPSLVVLFCDHELDGGAVAAGVADRLPGTRIIGCSSAGEFTERVVGAGGTSAVAIPRAMAARVATATVDVTNGVGDGVARATEEIEAALGASLRTLDPQRYVGLVLIDGLSGNEEEINQSLGRIAPFLSFVGGSAGDDLRFERTWVTTEQQSLTTGAVLAVLELTVPFIVLKTCSFVASDSSFTVTRADLRTRTVYELDQRPVTEVYSAAVGVPAEALDSTVFMTNPFGIMIDGAPWIRSPMRVTADGGLQFYCRLPEDTKVHLMQPTDLIADTTAALEQARDQLDGSVRGGILFNCILRRLELDASNRHAEFLRIFDGIPIAGLHTYGESWLGHINQTCTGLLLG